MGNLAQEVNTNMAQQLNRYRNFPKRRIEKVHSIVSQALTDGLTFDIVHTAEDSKTLVRSILTVEVIGVLASNNSFSGALAIKPQGIRVITPAAAESLDNPEPKEVIVRLGGFLMDNSNNTRVSRYEFDLKGQRKLRPGDELELICISDANASGVLRADCTLFFKE